MLVALVKTIFRSLCGRTEAPETPTVNQQNQSQAPQPQYQYPPPPQTVTGPYRPHQDSNQLNQSNDYYISLRAKANEHGDQMAKCFHESHEAFSRRNGALAKQLSNEGKEHQRKMEEYNRQASDWIFRENNKDSAPGEIDLHGLYVKEAIARAGEAITQAKRENKSEIRLIVGKGLHSQAGVAKIKPAIEELMEKHHLKAELDPHNMGVVVVEIGVPSGQRGLGADEISRRLEKKDGSCIIM